MSQAASEVQSPTAAPKGSAATTAVHKFGGSSVADAACFRRVAAILRAQPESTQFVVVSAMRGTTDALIALAESAARRGDGWKPDLETLRERHLSTTRDLLGDNALATVEWLKREFDELASLLHALSVLGTSNR